MGTKTDVAPRGGDAGDGSVSAPGAGTRLLAHRLRASHRTTPREAAPPAAAPPAAAPPSRSTRFRLDDCDSDLTPDPAEDAEDPPGGKRGRGDGRGDRGAGQRRER